MENLINFFSEFSSEFLGFLKNFEFAGNLGKFLEPNPYFFAVLFLLVVIFIYGISGGRGKMLLLLISLYPAIILIKFFPYKEELIKNFNIDQSFFLDIGLFLAAIFLINFLFSHSPLRILLIRERDRKSWLQILILSIFILGIVVTFINLFLPENFIKFNHPLVRYFNNEKAFFWWVFSALVSLAFLKKKGV